MKYKRMSKKKWLKKIWKGAVKFQTGLPMPEGHTQSQGWHAAKTAKLIDAVPEFDIDGDFTGWWSAYPTEESYQLVHTLQLLTLWYDVESHSSDDAGALACWDNERAYIVVPADVNPQAAILDIEY